MAAQQSAKEYHCTHSWTATIIQLYHEVMNLQKGVYLKTDAYVTIVTCSQPLGLLRNQLATVLIEPKL